MNASELAVFLCVFFSLRQNLSPTSHFFSSQSHHLLLVESIYNVPDSPYFNKVTSGDDQKEREVYFVLVTRHQLRSALSKARFPLV